MPKHYRPLTGRLPANRRGFEDVVRDLRHAIFSVVRNRPLGNGQSVGTPLGSGFFVAPEIFASACHVLNDPANPHQDGDSYLLVRNDGPQSLIHAIPNVTVGNQLHLWPEWDFALLRARDLKEQPFVAIDYGEWRVGKRIGVAGYPLARLHAVNGQLAFDGLIFRVADGTLNSTYTTTLKTQAGQGLPNVSIVEVNFLFVPGNSGGPVFDAETGRVGAFVHGYLTTKIRERVEEVGPPLAGHLPEGINSKYIENLNALYSIALRLNVCREVLEEHGARL